MSVSATAELLVAAPGHKPRAAARAAVLRIGTALLVLWGAVTAAFIALRFVPGDQVQAILGTGAIVTPELRAQITERYGLDRPIVVQYFDYLGGVLHGDLGTSYVLRRPVLTVLMEQLPNTITLVLSATLLALVIAFAVSLLTAHRAPWVRSLFRSGESLGIAVPSFWLGLMLITVFSFGLRMFPATGSSGFASLVLPTIALAIPVAATLSQVMRDNIEKTLDEPFIVAVRARGAGEIVVRVRHALRHSLVSVVTLAGWLSGTLIGGAVIIEQVFSRPGIGRMTFSAVVSKDTPIVLGVVIVAALFYVIVNAVIDLLYPLIDPRLRS
jgi:peptide/nickel transport system permease protein